MSSSIAFQVGIDVSRDELVVNIGGRKAGEFGNSEAGLCELRRVLPSGCQIHVEASGGYDRLARRVLGNWGYEVRVHNPRSVRRVADGMGFLAKTDALDAKALVEVGPLMRTKPAKLAFQEELCDISRSIQALQDQASDNKRRMGTFQLPQACVEALKAVNKTLAEQIARLEKHFLCLVKKSELKTRYKLLMSIPSIGPVTARVITCELAVDLSCFSPAQVTSYAGLAPMDNSSGKRDGSKHIRAGNMNLKRALYMPAVTAMTHSKWAKELYSRLKDKGRSHEQAIVAVMRKLLSIAVTVLKRGTPYTLEPKSKPENVLPA